MNLPIWEAAHLLTTLDMERQFPGVLFKSPKHLVNIWGSPTIGEGTEIAAFVEIGDGVVIGRMCKIGAYVFIPPCVTIGDGVFVGPRVTFTNDKILWESVATGANYTEEAIVENWWMSGFKVPTLGSGVLYITLSY